MSVTPVLPPPSQGSPAEGEKKGGVPWWVIVLVIGGSCMFAVPVIAIVAAIAIPNMIESRKGSNEAAAIGALRTLSTAQALHREGDKDKNEIFDYADSLDKLADERLIDTVLGRGTKQGYHFRIESGDQMRWSATAVPQSVGKSGDRSYFVDESGVIRHRRDGAPPTSLDVAVDGN